MSFACEVLTEARMETPATVVDHGLREEQERLEASIDEYGPHETNCEVAEETEEEEGEEEDDDDDDDVDVAHAFERSHGSSRLSRSERRAIEEELARVTNAEFAKLSVSRTFRVRGAQQLGSGLRVGDIACSLFQDRGKLWEAIGVVSLVIGAHFKAKWYQPTSNRMEYLEEQTSCLTEIYNQSIVACVVQARIEDGALKLSPEALAIKDAAVAEWKRNQKRAAQTEKEAIDVENSDDGSEDDEAEPVVSRSGRRVKRKMFHE